MFYIQSTITVVSGRFLWREAVIALLWQWSVWFSKLWKDKALTSASPSPPPNSPQLFFLRQSKRNCQLTWMKTVKKTTMMVVVTNMFFSCTTFSSIRRERQKAIPPRRPPYDMMNWSMPVRRMTRLRFVRKARHTTPASQVSHVIYFRNPNGGTWKNNERTSDKFHNG